MSATADGAGQFAVDVALGFGTNVVTVGAERGKATGYARLTVVSTALPGTGFSTAAPFPSRNFTIAADSAWSSRIEAQGFADPVFVDAATVHWGRSR